MIPAVLTNSLAIGRVVNVDASDTASIALSSGFDLRCVILESAVTQRPLKPGDAVVVVRPNADDELGVVLGRLSSTASQSPTQDRRSDCATQQTPSSLVLEASDELTLRVGDGSITIRKDGKILIKGKDLVSHAQRVNRIKGGSVSIN